MKKNQILMFDNLKPDLIGMRPYKIIYFFSRLSNLLPFSPRNTFEIISSVYALSYRLEEINLSFIPI